MTTLEYTILINRPLEEVFAIVADPRKDHLWCERVGDCEQVEGDGVAVGARFELQHSPSLQRPHVRRIEIVELDPPRRAVSVQEDNIARFTISYFLQPDPDGTRLKQRDEIEWKIGPVARQIGRRIIARHIGEQLHALKQLLEHGDNPVSARLGANGHLH